MKTVRLKGNPIGIACNSCNATGWVSGQDKCGSCNGKGFYKHWKENRKLIKAMTGNSTVGFTNKSI